MNQFSRTELIFGKTAMEKLYSSRIAVFGIGGVGSYTAEALVRSGVGAIDIFDDDKVCITNINRQLFATRKTVGKYKIDVAKERLQEINPDVKIFAHKMFFTNENGVPIISSMGAGNKIDPTKFEVADIYKTEVCPLAKVMRTELKKRGIKKLKVVYSKETPIKPKFTENLCNEENCICPKGTTRKCTAKRQIPGSNAFVPPVVGLIIAGEVIKDIVNL